MDEQLWVVWIMNEYGWFPTFEGTRDEAAAYLEDSRKRGRMAHMKPRHTVTLADIIEG